MINTELPKRFQESSQAQYPSFANPPIIEALIDFRVTAAPGIDLLTLASFGSLIDSDFPHRRNHLTMQGQISFGGPSGAASSATSNIDGFVFLSKDEKTIVQATTSGFTVNQLRPYMGWSELFGLARRWFPEYCRIAHALNVHRLGVRYINRVPLPLPFNDFQEYVLTIPELAPRIPQALENFFMQVLIPHESLPLSAVVTETIDTSSKDEKELPLVFDIDSFCSDAMESNSEIIWQKLNDLRSYKNRIFHESFTEDAKRLFR